MVHVQRYRQICDIYYMMKLSSSLLRYNYHYAGITRYQKSFVVREAVLNILHFVPTSYKLFKFPRMRCTLMMIIKYIWLSEERIFILLAENSPNKIIVFLGNARGCIFRTDGGEGKKNRTRGTGTRGAICSSFALITATKCLAREALVVSSATRRRPWAISTQVDPKRTTRNWNRSFKHSCESWWSKMLEDSLQISYKTCKRNQ